MHYKLIFWISDCCGCYGLNRLGYEGTSFYLLVSRYFPSSGSRRSAEDRREYWDEGTHQKCSTSVALGPFFHPMIWSLNSVPIRRANSKRVPALEKNASIGRVTFASSIPRSEEQQRPADIDLRTLFVGRKLLLRGRTVLIRMILPVFRYAPSLLRSEHVRNR